MSETIDPDFKGRILTSETGSRCRKQDPDVTDQISMSLTEFGSRGPDMDAVDKI
jgi:hypothetical protein